jgi:uncharacterized Zn-finger protein
MSQTAAQPRTESHPIPATDAIAVRRTDLPLCCPRPQDALWNMHPRVYLPIEDEPDRESVCPYCGARYRLVD